MGTFEDAADTDTDEAIERIYAALIARELDPADLSARRLAALLGKTTGALYHRWGSVDGVLFTVGQRGFVDLKSRVDAAWAKAHDVAACAVAFVEFGLDHPELYPLLFERRYDWAALRAGGHFARALPGAAFLTSVVTLAEAAGSKDPIADARILMAGLHGLVSFATSGRMNTGALSSSDRAVAIASARDLAARIAPKLPLRSTEPTSPKTRSKPDRKTKTPGTRP